MEAAKVPQHLELDDVVAWGFGAVDLLWATGGAACGWWLYLALPDSPICVLIAGTVAAAGLLFGLARVDGDPLRTWLAKVIAFGVRARLLVTGGPS